MQFSHNVQWNILKVAKLLYFSYFNCLHIVIQSRRKARTQTNNETEQLPSLAPTIDSDDLYNAERH